MGRRRVIVGARAGAFGITPWFGRPRPLAVRLWDGPTPAVRNVYAAAGRIGTSLKRADEKLPSFGPREKAAYERYLLSCSDYLKRQMIVYQHWPQRRYDTLGYRDEKVFTDMNN